MSSLNTSAAYRLKHQQQTIRIFLKDWDEGELMERLDPEKWSVKENVAHLGRYQEVFGDRINRIIKEERPEFERYRAEDDPKFGEWLALPLDDILKNLEEDRHKIFDFVPALWPATMERQGKHPKLGWMAIPDWVEFFLLHESHHLYTIFWLLREMKTRP